MAEKNVVHLRPREKPAMAPVLLRVAEAAERLKVSERSVWRWVRDGSMPHVRLGEDGRIVRIPVELLDEWWQRRVAGDR